MNDCHLGYFTKLVKKPLPWTSSENQVILKHPVNEINFLELAQKDWNLRLENVVQVEKLVDNGAFVLKQFVHAHIF